jgi:hypothetical protein
MPLSGAPQRNVAFTRTVKVTIARRNPGGELAMPNLFASGIRHMSCVTEAMQ